MGNNMEVNFREMGREWSVMGFIDGFLGG